MTLKEKPIGLGLEPPKLLALPAVIDPSFPLVRITANCIYSFMNIVPRAIRVKGFLFSLFGHLMFCFKLNKPIT